MQPICLAIDTTFDDTSVAILKGHNDILANLTLSQFKDHEAFGGCLLYTSPSPRDPNRSRMPSSA